MKSNGNPFQSVGIARIPRASFDLSHTVATTQGHGELRPLPPIECVPGDVFNLGISALVRANPLVTPPFMRAKLRSYSFFVPYRILDDNWEEFITKGEDGNSVVALPVFNSDAQEGATALDTLWDCYGFPLNFDTPDVDKNPIIYPWTAYWKIWNDFFRIPGIQDEVVFNNSSSPGQAFTYKPAYRNWTRDYFTSALPWAQRGTAPALPVFGTAAVSADMPFTTGQTYDSAPRPLGAYTRFGTPPIPQNKMIAFDSQLEGANTAYTIKPTPASETAQIKASYDAALEAGLSVDGSSFTGVDINDLRLTWQIQVWLERNARAGARYTEQLLSHFGRAPRDERLQRPEYIGGTVSDILFSEVVQTSETATTPQGKLAGHAISKIGSPVGSYRVLEHGLILTLVCITPDAVYHQGIHRSWTRRTTYDFYFPEFAGLGEQAIFSNEIYAAGDSGDLDVFGYTGRYNELRYLPNSVHGHLRPGQDFQQWTGARHFASRPTLSAAFVSMFTASASGSSPDLMRPWVVTNPSTTPPWVVQYAYLIEAHRPMPYLAEPSPILGG